MELLKLPGVEARTGPGLPVRKDKMQRSTDLLDLWASVTPWKRRDGARMCFRSNYGGSTIPKWSCQAPDPVTASHFLTNLNPFFPKQRGVTV